jgi:lipopolysaccharide/colanic/teichoic acid biosynthesis glycosyltransferase
MPGLDSLQSLRPDNTVRASRIGIFPPILPVPSAAGINARLKRAFDVLAAGGMLLLLAPIFLLLAALVRRDGGAAFYAHTRVGQGGRGFGCLKFRSMVTDSQARLDALLAADPAARAEWEATRKLKNDPRITAIGHILRKTSLDELPQLVNVLRGEMSLVGPRPVVAAELDEYYGPAAAQYMSLRPGITGLWQVSGRSDLSWEDSVRLDMFYVENWSIMADVVIALKTARVVFSHTGSY